MKVCRGVEAFEGRWGWLGEGEDQAVDQAGLGQVGEELGGLEVRWGGGLGEGKQQPAAGFEGGEEGLDGGGQTGEGVEVEEGEEERRRRQAGRGADGSRAVTWRTRGDQGGGEQAGGVVICGDGACEGGGGI